MAKPPTAAVARSARRGVKNVWTDPADIVKTPLELQAGARRVANMQRGSHGYYIHWRNWCTDSVEAVRHHLGKRLPHPACETQFAQLFFDLGQAADEGEMPSFQNPASRSGYAMAFFCRARLMADLILQLDDNKKSQSTKGKGKQPVCNILSLGGGPGFDFLGVLMAETFASAGTSSTRILGTVFDYEEGWKELVHAMNTATHNALPLPQDNHLRWGGTCDITKPLADHPANQSCRDHVPLANLIICQYCVAENAKPLRDSQFVFFRQLLQEASVGADVIITEVTPRLWPELVEILPGNNDDRDSCYQVDLCRAIRRSLGAQLVIYKKARTDTTTPNIMMSPEVERHLEEFRQLQQLHARRIDNGYQRQPRKIRGSKQTTTSTRIPKSDAAALAAAAVDVHEV